MSSCHYFEQLRVLKISEDKEFSLVMLCVLRYSLSFVLRIEVVIESKSVGDNIGLEIEISKLN